MAHAHCNHLEDCSKHDSGEAFTDEEPLPAVQAPGAVQQQQGSSQGAAYHLAQGCSCADAGVSDAKFTSIQEERQVIPHACTDNPDFSNLI